MAAAVAAATLCAIAPAADAGFTHETVTQFCGTLYCGQAQAPAAAAHHRRGHRVVVNANGLPASIKHAALHSLVATINYKLARYVHPTGKCGAARETLATYYWQGTRTATGAHFNPHGLTAAHRTLPFGTVLYVRNPHNDKAITVTVNDRGPYTHADIDLALGAAQALGLKQSSYLCITGAGFAAR